MIIDNYYFWHFLWCFSDYKKKIEFKGQLLIEPKPKEPTKHQYDYGKEIPDIQYALVSNYWKKGWFVITLLLGCSLGFPLFQSSPVCLFVSSWASMLLAHLCHCPSKSCESELWCAWPLWSSVCNKKITINNLTAEICACHSCQSSNLSGPLCIIGYCANTWPFFQIKTSRVQKKCCNVFPELPQQLHY